MEKIALEGKIMQLKDIFARYGGWIKWAGALVCCAASVWIMAGHLDELSGRAQGLVIYKGFVRNHLESIVDGLGYPVSLDVEFSLFCSLVVLCSSKVADALKLALANLFGIAALVGLAMFPGYLHGCTHDAVGVSAWLAGFWWVADGKRLRMALGACFVLMLWSIGEVSHGLGGSWCPAGELESLAGTFWVGAAGLVSSLAVFPRIVEARLGLARGDRGAWRTGVVMGLAISGPWLANFVGMDGDSSWLARSLGISLLFSVAIPSVAAALHVILGLWVLGRRVVERVRG